MKHFILAFILLFFSAGCQLGIPSSNWAIRNDSKKDSVEIYLGQAMPDDPFFQALHSQPTTPQPSFESLGGLLHAAGEPEQGISESETERIRSLALTSRDNMPDYLKPLNPWDGPFANRMRGRKIDQDIIRQVGYEPVVPGRASRDMDYEWDWDQKDEPLNKKFLGVDWSMLAPESFFDRVRSQVGMGPDEEKAHTSMQKGREILLSNPNLQDQRKNLEAARHFSDAAKKFPDSVLEEDALHLAGECYFFADDYPNAFTMYQKLVVKYHHSKHVDNAVRRLFNIGRYWEIESERSRSFFNFSQGLVPRRMRSDRSLPAYDTFGFAKKAYETIFIHDPLGPVSDDALMALANAYLKRGRHQGDDNFNQAAFYFQLLRDDHPASPHIAKAHESELYARTRAYLGPEHPSNTLNEARRLAEITLWQFQGELESADKEAILGIKESISHKEAERLWTTAQFWDLKKRHYGAARLYYIRLMADYPQTEYAELARMRTEQIENLHDKPPIFGLPANPFRR